MKCKIFIGNWYEVQDLFNAWAKGKVLTREVLIHEQVMNTHDAQDNTIMAIIVYHPEDPYWDKTEPEATIPVMNVPILQTRVEEIKVTQ